MKNHFLCLFLLLAALSCKTDEKETGNAEPREIGNYSIEQFMDIEGIGGGSFSHDNSKLLIGSNRSGIYNLYTVPISGGEFTALTATDSTSFFAISYFPNDDRVLFSADDNGDENSHIFLLDTTGTVKDLTPKDGINANFAGWNKDKDGFYFLSNERDPRYFDYYEMSLDGFNSELIYKNEDGMNIVGLSDDEKFMALSKTINTNDSDLYLVNTSTNERTKINDSLSGHGSIVFSKDNSKMYYTTDEGANFSYLASYDLETGEKNKILEKQWDISGVGLSENGTYRTVFINDDGKNVIEVYNEETGEQIDLPEFDSASITSVSFSPDEKFMRLYVGNSNTPNDLYIYSFENKGLTRITHRLNKDINPDDLVASQVIRYNSFDGTEIPAIYYLPKQASADNPVPALVWVHGGPGGQTRQGFNSFIQYLVNNGYAVLGVNNRGSSGYGKEFYLMDDLNHGEKDLQDCIEGKNWLAKQPEIDNSRIGIIGGSYGGYMTMAALTFAPEEFDVGVNIFGVTNWLRTLKSVPPYWESFKTALYKELGDPYSQDSVRLRKISPLFHAENVTKPVMVLQGAKDPRVLQVESDEIVEAVRKNNVPVEYVLFEDEGHGFVKKENQIEGYGKILTFLDNYLKGEKKLQDGKTESEEIEIEVEE
ncbi:S9 family peptidase [Aegicerativicinus sediminis]|uniref:S9 family peptidase n=1 Tax=Aegicerativicinus sediminis TaxID=2893202 RepID=UPI001E3FC5BC|nr:prolyl oligopeptidase family serine peptidase [Aegicerativicinus sediminis]